MVSIDSARRQYGIEETEEEAIAGQLPGDLILFYMWISGGTAEDKYGLETQELDGGRSRGALYVRDTLPV